LYIFAYILLFMAVWFTAKRVSSRRTRMLLFGLALLGVVLVEGQSRIAVSFVYGLINGMLGY